MEKRVVISEVINSKVAVSAEKGEMVFQVIENNIRNGVISCLDFSNIKSMITAFLNAAIGELYRIETQETLNTYVKFDVSTLTPVQLQNIKMVMDNAKEKNRPNLQEKLNEVALHGETD